MPTTFETNLVGSVKQEVESLIQGRQIQDPRLYEAILLLNDQIEIISRQLSPLVKKSLVKEAGISELPSPTSFTCFSTKITVRFTWDQVTYASQYEIREGTDWDTAKFRFRTTGLQGDIDPLKYGDYTFLIKTLDAEGNYSAVAESATFSVTHITAPAITVSVIDNNVMLAWTEPASVFKIDYYLVDKSGDGEASGRVDSTFTSIFEVVAGTYVYSVAAVDIAGNVSDWADVEAAVNTPPDFALQDTRVSDLMGDRVNVLRLPIRPSLLCCWQFPQTWEEHYRVFNDWMRPQEQVDAGYPIYIQPTAIHGSYEETVDYGVIVHNTIVTLTWNTIFHTPLYSMSIVVQMAVSNDGITFTDFNPGASQYFQEMRFLRFRLEFEAENDKTLIELYNLNIKLNVKRENDGGEILADVADVGGTRVDFNKLFRDIESITCTTKSSQEPYVVIFDFTDIPNPTHFFVYVFDTMGARVTKLVDWKARGIV